MWRARLLTIEIESLQSCTGSYAACIYSDTQQTVGGSPTLFTLCSHAISSFFLGTEAALSASVSPAHRRFAHRC